MSGELDAARLAILESIAMSAVLSNVFPSIGRPGHWETAEGTPAQFIPDTSIDALNAANCRALMALIAADELGMSLIDALNRVRFDGAGDMAGLSFAPATTSTFEQAIRTTIASAQKDAAKETAKETAKASLPPSADIVIPTGYPRAGDLIADLAAGELAYFVEEATGKGVDDQRRAAWRQLSHRIPQADALELSKLTRWILNAKVPKRKEFFADVLTVAEARIKEIGGAAT